jgi:hypothetical protein
MAANDYHFVTHWRVLGTADEVSEILERAEDLPRWWPSVYLDVKEIEPGGAGGIGKIVSLYTKGWLPYALRWKFRVIESNKPHGFALEAFGDFQGRGVWTFRQEGACVDVTYDWRITAGKPLIRALSFLLKPVFSANHRWAMATGEQSLVLELARRRAVSDEEAARVPHPPGPTFPHSLRKRVN